MAGPRKTTGSSKSTSTGKAGTGSRSRTGTKTSGSKRGAKPAPPAMKLVEPAPKPDITVVTPAKPVVADRLMKKPELVARVMEATRLDRKDVKPVVEATLAELAAIIGEGTDMQMPELGKLMIHKRKPLPNGEMVMLKLRRKTAVKPLAEDDDNG
ncbi:HU family DNA-binding protein [Vannielia litorea]|uniref:HU family DNA-binding protein n=1 Tax=Vannielia litorea TaxID=1217970 RepID=UPI001BD10A54|nr:HU family DNA-binding protein [Vannielia litorea]MBS8228949.1 hypothetical protein [Vannielia litorea]